MVDCNLISTHFASEMKFQANCSLLFDATIYQSLVGSLLNVSHTQCDIAFTISMCIR